MTVRGPRHDSTAIPIFSRVVLSDITFGSIDAGSRIEQDQVMELFNPSPENGGLDSRLFGKGEVCGHAEARRCFRSLVDE